MANLTVSIIITRNRPSLLRHCLEHVLAQSYPYKEIIVVDSSSNDESKQVVAQYPEVISILLYGQRNNMPQARNEGIGVSSNDIITFVDDDAMVQPGWFDALVDTYRDETVGAVGGLVIEVPKPHCDLLTDAPIISIRPSGQVIVKNIGAASVNQVEVDWLPGGNISCRRTVLEQVGGFDPLAPARTCGLTVYRAGLMSIATVAQSVDRVAGLVAGIHWLISSRRRAESAPKIRQPDPSIALHTCRSVLNKME